MKGKLCKKGLVVKKLSDTRWSARHDAIRAIIKSEGAIMDALEELASDEEQTPTTRHEAGSISEKIDSLKPAFMVLFWYDLLDRIHRTNLSRMNDELREQNMDMSHIISDLKMANKNLEKEKSSLLTAFKLLQNDYQQTCTKTIVENDGEKNVVLACETIEGNEVNQSDPSSKQPDINKHNTEANIGKSRKKKGKKSKPKSPRQNPSKPTEDENTSDGIMNASSSKSRDKARKQLLAQGTQLLKT